MLCSFGSCPCKLALPAEGSEQEVVGTQMVIVREARAAPSVGFRSNELAAERKECLSTRKSLNDRGTVCLDSEFTGI